jgi:hypothetical protein
MRNDFVMQTIRFLVAILAVLYVSPVVATAADAADGNSAKPKSYFLIGNSLTWDTTPSLLDGDVQWHVDCGVNLPYIYAHPEKPCVKTSTLWPKALAEKQYDFVSVQPHYGSTIAQDVETISAWMKLQPQAVFVIHSGWAFHAKREAEFDAYAAPVQMEHSPAYFRALIAELKKAHPGREIRQTMAQNLLAQIDYDVASGIAPIKTVEELYRDDIHLTHDAGKYLMHNAMRRALGQPPSTKGFEKVDPKVKEYLDRVLALLATTPADRVLLKRILAVDTTEPRAELVEQLSQEDLKASLRQRVGKFVVFEDERRKALVLQAEVEKIGGRLHYSPAGPEWLYLATRDEGTEIYDVPTAIDLYNGNNPLKGKGGRNELANDAWLKHVVDYPTLQKLDLANCEIHGDGLQHVGTLIFLRELNLTLTPVADDALEHLRSLTSLRTLGLASTKCTGTGFEHLKELKKLENVNLHFTPVNDAGLKAISLLPLTGRLWLGHTHFTDAGAAHLAGLAKLKRCGIGSMEKASSGEAVGALVKLPLEDLTLLDNQATPVGVAHAAKIATLQKLDISHGPTVTDESLPLLAAMSELTELKIGSAQLTDDGLQALASAKKLKKLSLSGVKKVTPAGVERLQKARPELVIEVK